MPLGTIPRAALSFPLQCLDESRVMFSRLVFLVHVVVGVLGAFAERFFPDLGNREPRHGRGRRRDGSSIGTGRGATRGVDGDGRSATCRSLHCRRRGTARGGRGCDCRGDIELDLLEFATQPLVVVANVFTLLPVGCVNILPFFLGNAKHIDQVVGRRFSQSNNHFHLTGFMHGELVAFPRASNDSDTVALGNAIDRMADTDTDVPCGKKSRVSCSRCRNRSSKQS